MKFLIYFLFAVLAANAFCFEYRKSGALPKNIFFPMNRHSFEPAEKKFPYQVGILVKDSDSELSWCGGSLIDHEWILTAAHCIEGVEEATVYLGASHRHSAAVTHIVNNKSFIIHPEWDSDNIENDISLIKIPYTHYSANISAVKLPAVNESYSTYSADDVITSGWGSVSDSSTSLSNDLRWSVMSIFSIEICRDYFGWVVRHSNICVGNYGAPYSCRGDTGGPLVLKSSMTQIGVSSFGSDEGCEKGIPSVFTRVSLYADWIKNNIDVNLHTHTSI